MAIRDWYCQSILANNSVHKLARLLYIPANALHPGHVTRPRAFSFCLEKQPSLMRNCFAKSSRLMSCCKQTTSQKIVASWFVTNLWSYIWNEYFIYVITQFEENVKPKYHGQVVGTTYLVQKDITTNNISFSAKYYILKHYIIFYM